MDPDPWRRTVLHLDGSRARGGREINVEPEVEFRPEIEFLPEVEIPEEILFLPEVEIPAETDEEVSGATRHLTDIASQYIPEVTLTQEVRTSASITTSRLPPIPRNTTLTQVIPIPPSDTVPTVGNYISTKWQATWSLSQTTNSTKYFLRFHISHHYTTLIRQKNNLL